MALESGSPTLSPTPHHILAVIEPDIFLVSFAPDAAGIISQAPGLLSKSTLSTHHPHLIAAWDANQLAEKQRAKEIEQNATSFARYLGADDSLARAMNKVELEPTCDQRLLSGMRQHWGEVRKCELHNDGQGDMLVCQGCRVHHYDMSEGGFDRGLIMRRGARVPMCGRCAAAAVNIHGVGHRGCVCDAKVSCYRCRERVLEKLADVRFEKHREGWCGRCGEEGAVEFAEICLYCQRMRVYDVRSEETA